MSMLSARYDELRELATRYDELQVGAVKAVTMPSDMGSILREAADTIWELRDSVHRERAEADKLREQGARLFDKTLELGTENTNLRERITTQKQTIQAYRDESREWREVADHAQAENAKLREACAELLKMAERHDPEWPHWPEMHEELRELGVVVE